MIQEDISREFVNEEQTDKTPEPFLDSEYL